VGKEELGKEGGVIVEIVYKVEGGGRSEYREGIRWGRREKQTVSIGREEVGKGRREK
jgi:hypothetical protein